MPSGPGVEAPLGANCKVLVSRELAVSKTTFASPQQGTNVVIRQHGA
jgi:hypothetical protein